MFYTYLVTYNSKARTPNKVFRAVACDEGRGDVRNDISLSELDLNDLPLAALVCSHNLSDQEY